MWFADILSTLAVPTESHRLAQLVESAWAKLSMITKRQVSYPVFAAVGPVGRTVHLLRRGNLGGHRAEAGAGCRAKSETAPTDLKLPEWQAFTHPESVPRPTTCNCALWPCRRASRPYLERVVLLGTSARRAGRGRLHPARPAERVGCGGQPGVEKHMTVSRQKPAWVPATEVRGEGLFIQFKESAIQAGLDAMRSTSADGAVQGGARGLVARPAPGAAAGQQSGHALHPAPLLRACPHAAAGPGMRLLGGQHPRAHLLRHRPGADGRDTHLHLRAGQRRDAGRPGQPGRAEGASAAYPGGPAGRPTLCASDPLCAEHTPGQKDSTLHGAACHACMFAPETSCEKGNKYLDRSLLAATLQVQDLAFFAHEVEP